MKPQKKYQGGFAAIHAKITQPDKSSSDFDSIKDIETELALNKILDFSFSSETIEEFFQQSLIEIGKFYWLCADAKCSICLLDSAKKNLLLIAHKNLTGREIKNCALIPLIGKFKNEMEIPGIKTRGHLINTMSEYFIGGKKEPVNRYILNLKRGTQTPGIIYVQTKYELNKDKSASRFITAFINLAADTIIRKENEAALIFEKKANDSIAELSNIYLSAIEISINDISNMVLKKAQGLVGSEFGFMGYIDQDTGRPIIPVLNKKTYKKGHIKEHSAACAKFIDLLGHGLKGKKTSVFNKIKKGSLPIKVPKGSIPIDKFLAVPAVFNNKLIGIIAIANAKKDYTQTDWDYLKRLADFYAIALNRKFEEDKLKYAEEQYRTITESSNNLVYTINPDGIITFINKNIKNYGYKPSEIMGNHMSNFCHPDDLVLAYAELEKILKTGKPSDRFIMRFKRKNGTFYYGEQRSGVLYKNGKVVSMICNMHDITERKKNEAALIFEKKANDSIAELSNIYLSAIEISINDISNMVLKKAQGLVGSEFGFMGYIDQDTGRPIIPVLNKKTYKKGHIKEHSAACAKFIDLLGHGLKGKKTSVFNKIKKGSLPIKVPKGSIPIDKFLAVPAVFNNKLIGIIAIANAKKDYTQTDWDYLKRLADFYAIALNRKFEEDKLKYAEEQYRTITESSNNLVYTINPDGIITFINKNIKNYGYKPSEIMGNHMSNFCHPDDLVLAYAELEKILKTGKPSDRFIMRFKRKNGTFYYGEQRSGVLYKKGKIVSMICNMHDISQTKEMQDKIRESKEMLQTIFDTTPYIIFIKDINNKFLKINKAGANFFNLPIKKILGKTCYDLFPPETAKTLIAEEKVVLTQGKTLNSETKIKSDKGIRIVDSIKTPIRSEQGKVTGFLAILRDVTEFKKLQEESIHKKILEEAGKITGNVAHDFNNVLAAISGYSTLVLEELGDKNPVRMEMEAIKKAVSRAVKITDTLQRKPPYKK